MKKRIHFILFLLLFINYGFSTIINIPTDYNSIQLGIDHAIDGDTVLVQRGLYFENIDFNGKDIVVGSLFLTTNDTSHIPQTVIDGYGTGSVVSFMNGESRDAELVGFSITNGGGTEGNYGITSGGGINIINSSPILKYLYIYWNNSSNGGGINVENSNPAIYYCLLENNISTADGGGVRCTDDTNIVVKNTVLRKNRTDYGGGAIRATGGCNVYLTNVLMYDNSCTAGYGNSINSWNSNFYLFNTTVGRHNGDTLIWLRGNSWFTLFNSILWNDNYDANHIVCMDDGIRKKIWIYYSTVYNGQNNFNINSNSKFDWGPGNRTEFPQFKNIDDNDYQLYSYSFCFDGGYDDVLYNDYDSSRNAMGFEGGTGLSHNRMTMEFDTLQVGNFDYKWLTIRNHRDVEFKVDYLGLSDKDNFSLNDYSGFDIPPFSEYEFPIIFNPVDVGDISGVLYINSDDLYGRSYARLELNGHSKIYVNTTEDNFIPVKLELSQNHPNPFNPNTTIFYGIDKDSEVTISVYDISGKLITTLQNKYMTKGIHSITWNGTDNSGNEVGGGVYFYQVRAGDFMDTKKMVLVK